MNATAARSMLTIAAVYGYFLLFAQFAFVELVRANGANTTTEKFLLGFMALAGVTSGFLAAWRGPSPFMIRGALACAAVAAAMGALAGNIPTTFVVAVMTGACLGIATVSLAALLPGWCGLLPVGIGTGLGYAICNLPMVFQAPPAQQAWISAVMAIAGLVAVPSEDTGRATPSTRCLPFASVLLLFTSLVWMDSAAFFIIQHAIDLKSGTWGDAHLWRNAALHLLAAIASGFILSKSPKLAPLAGWILLAVAAFAVNSASSREWAGWLYPPAVSLYSVALVAWPGWFSGATDSKSTAWKAAWLFAIAGWFGSANGIGMAQTLQRVPISFIILAGCVVIMALILADIRRWRFAIAFGVVVIAGSITLIRHDTVPTTAALRGRMVYVAEGCIHCHSRYTRPESKDETTWGPAPDTLTVLKEQPVLIGNRRQGPDLANVGARRSEAWLKAHFIEPRTLSPDSTMPSYAHLFDNSRGDDLVRYLRESGIQHMPALMAQQQQWTPKKASAGQDAPQLYARHCAACHGNDADGHGPLAAQLHVKVPNLRHGPFARTPDGEDLPVRIARIIKFGVIGSDMPGHETLSDGDIMALANLLAGWRTEAQ